MQKVCIVGMGYVGLTLACHASKYDFEVYGIEIDQDKVDILSSGKSYFYEKGLDSSISNNHNKNLFFMSDVPKDILFDVIIITVGTPLIKGSKDPDLSLVNNAINSVRHNLNQDTLIIFRSTVKVGLTREIYKSLKDKLSFEPNIAFCPERTAEGVALEELSSLPQIIGGINKKSEELAHNFFKETCSECIIVSSLEEAELIKLFNNTYRDAIFSIANVFSLIAQDHGIDGLDAINNANYNYPRSSIPKPGFVAGPCLEKDAYILAETIKDTQLKHYIKLIRQSNESLEGKVAEKIINDLSNNNDKKVLISGLSFKGQPETSDLRGSSSINILNEIPKEYVDRVELHDFMVNINEMPDNLNFILRNNIDFFIVDLPNFQ